MEPRSDEHVTLEFSRDLHVSNQAFWAYVQSRPDNGQPTWTITFPSDADDGASVSWGCWRAQVNQETRSLQVRSEGDRNDWRSVRSVPGGFIDESGQVAEELGGHEVSAIFNYLDARELLAATLQLLTEGDGERLVTLDIVDSAQIVAVSDSLALGIGATMLRISIAMPASTIERVERYFGDQICETVDVRVGPEPATSVPAR